MEKFLEVLITEDKKSNNEDALKFLEDSLKENNITYEIKEVEKWTNEYKNVSKCYKVKQLFLDKKDFDKAKDLIKDYNNSEFIVDNINELKNTDEEEDTRFKIFTKKNFLKIYWIALLVIGIILAIIIIVES